jgi:hypothetical protein
MFVYSVVFSSWEEGGREREREMECLKSFVVLIFYCLHHAYVVAIYCQF